VAVPLEKFVCNVEQDCPRNCTCIKRPSNLTFSVSCPAGTHDSLSDRLPNPDQPPPPIGRFQLDFSESNIQTLKLHRYLGKTTWIDLSRSKIYSIQDNVWRSLSHVDHVDLSENHLAVFPKLLTSENITFRWLAIYNNPLRCNCINGSVTGCCRLATDCLHLVIICLQGAAHLTGRKTKIKMS